MRRLNLANSGGARILGMVTNPYRDELAAAQHRLKTLEADREQLRQQTVELAAAAQRDVSLVSQNALDAQKRIAVLENERDSAERAFRDLSEQHEAAVQLIASLQADRDRALRQVTDAQNQLDALQPVARELREQAISNGQQASSLAEEKAIAKGIADEHHRQIEYLRSQLSSLLSQRNMVTEQNTQMQAEIKHLRELFDRANSIRLDLQNTRRQEQSAWDLREAGCDEGRQLWDERREAKQRIKAIDAELKHSIPRDRRIELLAEKRQLKELRDAHKQRSETVNHQIERLDGEMETCGERIKELRALLEPLL